MTAILHVSASTRGELSVSKRVSQTMLTALRVSNPAARVVNRDIGTSPIPHPDAKLVRASLAPAAEHGPTASTALTVSEELIGELEAADLLLISTPMHNFAVPSTLKAWLDHVMRPGRTFRSGPTGKVGLLADRPAIAVVACGGRFGQDPGTQRDFLSPYLRYALRTIGITRLEILRLEELARGPEKVAIALQQADSWIAEQLGRLTY
ncbi:FMN-dependent NADH-azoreductase [Mycolicibacterium sp. CH28]|uniref:FMN-dependent NADH-azoreductase n=1 Tax=Mycolicibacterium sp. CH28 TaxID=2512237 RepID=UPI001080DC11|nr:NAD(P)H-dependent oxidoreductase [Mycolicibacterium sp. CH28]TGD87316.1 FMN-dependent NADH-azoreductase [Mycolicibacterium sp. CH28]